MDKFRHKLPKEELKKFGRDVNKKLVASDYKNNRVDDPTSITPKQERKVKQYAKDFFDRATQKYRDHEKKKAERAARHVPKPAKDDIPDVPLSVEQPAEALGGDDDDVVLSDVEAAVSSPSNSSDRKRKREDLDGDSPNQQQQQQQQQTPSETPSAKRLKEDESDAPSPPPPPPPPPEGAVDTPITEEEQSMREQEEALMRENEEAQRLADEEEEATKYSEGSPTPDGVEDRGRVNDRHFAANHNSNTPTGYGTANGASKITAGAEIGDSGPVGTNGKGNGAIEHENARKQGVLSH